MNYSVLMSVYYKENPQFLRQSMDSIFNQTLKTDDFVLVCDGPLTDELNDVICEFKSKHSDVLNIVRLEKNQGLGIALNTGMNYCKNELIARMDSDDVSFEDRCEKQVEVFKKNNVDIISGVLIEFEDDINHLSSKKVLPEYNEEIIKYSKKRSPFNHPCVMYKKSSVLEAGGYIDFYHLEDYYLWIRMLSKGFVGYNIQEPILYMRIGNGMHKRRGGLKYFSSNRKLLKYMRKIKYISFFDYIYISFVRFNVSIMPNFMRKFVYNFFLRKK